MKNYLIRDKTSESIKLKTVKVKRNLGMSRIKS